MVNVQHAKAVSSVAARNVLIVLMTTHENV